MASGVGGTPKYEYIYVIHKHFIASSLDCLDRWLDETDKWSIARLDMLWCREVAADYEDMISQISELSFQKKSPSRKSETEK